MILENPKVTQAFIAEELGITTWAVKRNIKELVGNGFVERIGSARGGIWKSKLKRAALRK